MAKKNWITKRTAERYIRRFGGGFIHLPHKPALADIEKPATSNSSAMSRDNPKGEFSHGLKSIIGDTAMKI